MTIGICRIGEITKKQMKVMPDDKKTAAVNRKISESKNNLNQRESNGTSNKQGKKSYGGLNQNDRGSY